MAHPPPPPVNYFPPGNRIDPWRPWWLKLLLALKLPQAHRIDEQRHKQFLEDTHYLIDE